MSEDENQSFFFQREIYSFHNYDQFNDNLNHQIQFQPSNNDFQGNQIYQSQGNYKIDGEEMQLEDIHHENQDPGFLQQQISLSGLKEQQNHSLNYSKSQQMQQQQFIFEKNQNFQFNHISVPKLSSPPPLEKINSNEFCNNNYLKSEDEGRNFRLLANILDESEQNVKLNDFYYKNKILHGLNCFMLLDDKSPKKSDVTNNFCDDPYFSLGLFFDEKNKNEIFSEENIIQNDSLQASYQPSNPIPENQQQDYKLQKQFNKIQQSNEINKNVKQNMYEYLKIESQINLNELKNQSNNEQQFLHDFISGYLQQNSQNNLMKRDFQNNNNIGHFHHNQNNHDPINKGLSKNAFQRSSNSFLDKVTFAVDDFLDKQDPNEYPELKGGEDFLMTNLKNYLLLESSYNEESSYFQKFLNSSYQIFLQRLKLLLDQKRMDSNTLLPFVCRFSIEMAEKLLQFIYKCDDKFTMKILREQTMIFKKDFNQVKKQASTSVSQQNQNFGNKLFEEDFSIYNKNYEDGKINFQNAGNEKKNQSPQNMQDMLQKNDQPQSQQNLNSLLQVSSNQSISQTNLKNNSQNFVPLNSQTQKLLQSSQEEDLKKEILEGIEEEEIDDQLPFPVQKLVYQEKAQRKQWKKSEINELMSKYREYQQKIPPSVIDGLTKKFNRSIQSIQSKIQKLRKHYSSQNTDMTSESSINQFSSNISGNHQNFYQTIMQDRLNQIPNSLNNGNQNNLNILKIESKLKNCLYESENQCGTKSEILKKMKEMYYNNTQGGQSSAWETSAKQLLSSSSFQRRKGVFQLKEDVQITEIDNSSSYKQKLIYILLQLEEKKGSLDEIINQFLKRFNNETDRRKVKENIQKVLNQCSDCFDKSQSKTIYYLTPQEIALISQDIQVQQQTQQSQISNNQISQQINTQQQLSVFERRKKEMALSAFLYKTFFFIISYFFYFLNIFKLYNNFHLRYYLPLFSIQQKQLPFHKMPQNTFSQQIFLKNLCFLNKQKLNTKLIQKNKKFYQYSSSQIAQSIQNKIFKNQSSYLYFFTHFQIIVQFNKVNISLSIIQTIIFYFYLSSNKQYLIFRNVSIILRQQFIK